MILNYGVQPSSQNTTIITLKRNNNQYRIPLNTLFDNSSPSIVIQDKDQVEIEEINQNTLSSELVVGSRGYILIPSLGSFKAENMTLSDLRDDISRELLKKGLIPTFQIEVTDFRSRKFFLISENFGNKVIPLGSSKLNIRDAILNNISSNSSYYNSKSLTLVELGRNGDLYRITLQELLSETAPKVFIKDGDMLGHRSVLSEEPVNLSVVALEEVRVCFIPKLDVVKSIHANKYFSKSMFKLVCHELKDAHSKLTNMAQKTVRERLADTLLFLDETFGEDAQGYLNIRLSREEIANAIGTSTESAIRSLSEMNKEQLVSLFGKKIKLLKKKRLKTIGLRF